MTSRTACTIAVLCTVASTLACGSTTKEEPKEVGGNNIAQENAIPCGIDTGFPGDEYCIQAPDPSVGFQLHYGPKNYNDPVEVERYMLQPGEEKTDCVFVKTGNETEVFFNEYHGRMRPGSHHMLLYVQDTHVPDSTGPGSCNQGLDTRNIFGAQTPTIDVERISGGAAENEGLAVHLGAQLQGVVQMHFINTGDEPILREGWANIIYAKPEEVKVLGDPIFFLGGIGMNVPPGETQVISGRAEAPADVRLVAATGHYHAHTVRFSAWKTIGGQRDFLMQDFDWHEPALVKFDSVTQNPAYDPAKRSVAGYTGIVQLKQGDFIDWECEVVNDGDVPLGFGNEVYTAEMCNVFGMYAPTIGGAWRAVNM
jgi:hypothetical protein